MKLSKREIEKKIEKFFLNLSHVKPKEVKKIKRLAASKRIGLSFRKKLFCSSCLNPYSGQEKIRIRGGFKTIECLKCSKIKRIKLS